MAIKSKIIHAHSLPFTDISNELESRLNEFLATISMSKKILFVDTTTAWDRAHRKHCMVTIIYET